MIQHLEINYSLLFRHNNEGILNRIVTCDEKWILYDNRRHSVQWADASKVPKYATIEFSSADFVVW